jgi:hypothetical protein
MGAVAKSPSHEVGSAHPRSRFHLVEPFLVALREGVSMRAAALAVGLNPETVAEWRWKGKKWPEKYPQYAELNDKIDTVQAEVQREMVTVVVNTAKSGAPNTWQAAAWYLERTDPENWARRDKVSVKNEGGPLVQVNQVILTDADARAASRDLLNRLAAGGAAEPFGPGSRAELAAGGGGDRPQDIDVDSR